MRRTALTAIALVGIGGLALPSSAAPPKPITKTYTATGLPAGLSIADYCDNVPTSHDKHFEPFDAPAKGSLKVQLTASVGDWDVFLLDAEGATLSSSANLGVDPESYTFKVKKAQKFTLMSCNSLGGPTAEVTYTFTFSQ